LTVTGTLTSTSSNNNDAGSDNTALVTTNTANITTNTTNIATNASGIAGAMAMAQLSAAGPGEKLVISLGGGAWEGSTAMAAGGCRDALTRSSRSAGRRRWAPAMPE